MWTSRIGGKNGSIYIIWSKVLGSLLGSGPCWPEQPTSTSVNSRVFASKLSGVWAARLWPGYIWKSFSWPRLSSASECGHGTVSPVPGHTNSSGTEFIHLCEGTNFHGPLVLQHAKATVSLVALSHCWWPLWRDESPILYRRPWMSLGSEAVQPPCSETFMTQLGEAQAGVTTQLSPHGAGGWIWAPSNLNYSMEQGWSSVIHWATLTKRHLNAQAVSVRGWLLYSTIHKEWLWTDGKYGQVLNGKNTSIINISFYVSELMLGR